MAFIEGSKLGMELCAVLGLDPGNIASLTLGLRSHEVATVVIKRFISTDEADKFKTVLKKYRLVEPTSPVTEEESKRFEHYKL